MRRGCAKCGLAVMDSATDVLPSVLRWLGKDPDSTDPADLRPPSRRCWRSARISAPSPASGALLDMLATGEVCVALTYSGDVIQAAARAREAGRGRRARLRRAEGRRASLVRPAGDPGRCAEPARRREAFIDFLLQPEMMAAITSQVRYPNAVPASRPLVAPAVRDDPNVYPPEAALAAAFVPGTLTQAAERARTPDLEPLQGGRGAEGVTETLLRSRG